MALYELAALVELSDKCDENGNPLIKRIVRTYEGKPRAELDQELLVGEIGNLNRYAVQTIQHLEA